MNDRGVREALLDASKHLTACRQHNERLKAELVRLQGQVKRFSDTLGFYADGGADGGLMAKGAMMNLPTDADIERMAEMDADLRVRVRGRP